MPYENHIGKDQCSFMSVVQCNELYSMISWLLHLFAYVMSLLIFRSEEAAGREF